MTTSHDDAAADPGGMIAGLRRRLDERTAERDAALAANAALAGMLELINANPGELQLVFDTILEKALDLTEASFGGLIRYNGSRFQAAALRGVPQPYIDFWRGSPDSGYARPGSTTWDLIHGAKVIHIEDVKAEDAYRDGVPDRRALVDLGGARTMLVVALRKDDRLLGQIAVYRAEVRRFSDGHIALLENFAVQAVLAMENARLLTEQREALERETAATEVLRVINSNPGELQPVFDTILEKALDLTGSAFGSLSTFDGECFHTPAMRNIPEDVAAIWRQPIQPSAGGASGRIVRGESLIHIADITDTSEYRSGAKLRRLLADGCGARSLLWVALRREGTLLGLFSTYRTEVRPFSEREIGLLRDFAAQAVIAMDNARLLEEIRAARDAAETSLHDLKLLQANLIQAEKMASLGQLTAGIAHEIKNPLNFVNNFASMSVELLDELKAAAAPGFAALDDDSRADIDELSTTLTANLNKIVQHGRRADGIVVSMLEHSRGASGERRAVDINALVEEAMNLAYHGAKAQDRGFDIAMERNFGAGIAPVNLNPRDMTRVCLNLFGNGFYAARARQATEGAGFQPTLTVTTRDTGGGVEIVVRDNGTGVPPGIRDKLFQPFFTTKPTGQGTGLGLSITYDIVTKQHGGTITLESETGDHTAFTVTIPRAT